MALKQETKDISSKIFEITLGISYEEFEQLDFDEQQKLIAMHRRKIKRTNLEEVTTMIGSGEHSCFVEAGISPEEESQEFNNKPVVFVKKLQRQIRNK